jgi:hypothetical protein
MIEPEDHIVADKQYALGAAAAGVKGTVFEPIPAHQAAYLALCWKFCDVFGLTSLASSLTGVTKTLISVHNWVRCA